MYSDKYSHMYSTMYSTMYSIMYSTMYSNNNSNNNLGAIVYTDVDVSVIVRIVSVVVSVDVSVEDKRWSTYLEYCTAGSAVSVDRTYQSNMSYCRTFIFFTVMREIKNSLGNQLSLLCTPLKLPAF